LAIGVIAISLVLYAWKAKKAADAARMGLRRGVDGSGTTTLPTDNGATGGSK